MKFTTTGGLKQVLVATIVMFSSGLYACQDNGTSSNAGTSDSVHSGLEGTRDAASQLSNATIDTSSGQNVEKAAPAKDSSGRRDSLTVK